MPEKGKDWVTPVVLVGGGAAVVTGLVIFLKKKQLGAGQELAATFLFEYKGPRADYTFRITMGHTIGAPPVGWFDEMEETRYEESAEVTPSSDWSKHKIELIYQVPEVLAPDKYDVEFSIRQLDGSIVHDMRVIANDIIRVEE